MVIVIASDYSVNLRESAPADGLAACRHLSSCPQIHSQEFIHSHAHDPKLLVFYSHLTITEDGHWVGGLPPGGDAQVCQACSCRLALSDVSATAVMRASISPARCSLPPRPPPIQVLPSLTPVPRVHLWTPSWAKPTWPGARRALRASCPPPWPPCCLSQAVAPGTTPGTTPLRLRSCSPSTSPTHPSLQTRRSDPPRTAPRQSTS